MKARYPWDPATRLSEPTPAERIGLKPMDADDVTSEEGRADGHLARQRREMGTLASAEDERPTVQCPRCSQRFKVGEDDGIPSRLPCCDTPVSMADVTYTDAGRRALNERTARALRGRRPYGFGSGEPVL